MSVHKKMTFVSDSLVEQIIRGEKTASVSLLEEVNVVVDGFDDSLVVGEYYDVYDSTFVKRTTIRIIAMELCRWDSIPERLWRGETNSNAEEFRSDHREFFNDPTDDFEFAAYYFVQCVTKSDK